MNAVWLSAGGVIVVLWLIASVMGRRGSRHVGTVNVTFRLLTNLTVASVCATEVTYAITRSRDHDVVHLLLATFVGLVGVITALMVVVTGLALLDIWRERGRPS